MKRKETSKQDGDNITNEQVSRKTYQKREKKEKKTASIELCKQNDHGHVLEAIVRTKAA